MFGLVGLRYSYSLTFRHRLCNVPILTFHSFISSHLISSHLISSHLISSHLISSHLISSHLISSHLISSHLISSHLITSHLISSHLTVCHGSAAEPLQSTLFNTTHSSCSNFAAMHSWDDASLTRAGHTSAPVAHDQHLPTFCL